MNLQDARHYLYDAWYERCKEYDWLLKNTIFLSIHGSTAYGLNTPESDVDITGVCIPPKEYWFSYYRNFEQLDFKSPDGQIYGLKKFLFLATNNNPNVMELLWIDSKYWIIANSIWRKLVDNRHLFLSKKVRHTYSGYAISQLKRIETHRKWLLDPPTHKPTRKEFDLPTNKVITRDQQGALQQLLNEGKIEITDVNFMKMLQQENLYKRAMQEWEQYEHWKANRNPARAETERKYGYDVKHAMHLVRLIRQCESLLSKRELQVERIEDREELLAVRNGAWTYDELISWAKQKDEVELTQLYEKSSLPYTPQTIAIEKLSIDIVEEFLR